MHWLHFWLITAMSAARHMSSYAGGLSTGPDLDLCMLDVLLRHSSERLAVLAKIMQCATQSPGSIAALLHSFTLDGSHLTAIIAESLLQQVSKGAVS